MKTAIFYFSGTGNTEYIARYINRKLVNTQLYNIENLEVVNLSEYDCFIVGFPVYACDIPQNVKVFLGKFPKGNKPFYLFSTKGFYSGISLQTASHILRKKGYQLMSYKSVTMPGSDGLAMMKSNNKLLLKMINKDFSHIGKIDEWLNHYSKKKRYIFNPFNYLLSYILKGLYKVFEKRIKNKFHVNESCTHCRFCEKHCPQNNIEVSNNKVIFNNNCLLCMRCIHHCPKEAIQIGKMTEGKFRYKGPNKDFNL